MAKPERDTWTWKEVCLATEDNYRRCLALHSKAQGGGLFPLPIDARNFDKLAAHMREAFKGSDAVADRFLDMTEYHADESVLKARDAQRRAADPRLKARELAKIHAAYTEDVAKHTRAIEFATVERDGKLWMAEHGVPLDNVIFYTHSKTWAFGWMSSGYISDEGREHIKAAMVGWPVDKFGKWEFSPRK